MNMPRDIVIAALEEDRWTEDWTSLATIDAHQSGRAVIVAKAEGILSGREVADAVFHTVNRDIEIEWHCKNGDELRAGDTLCTLQGKVRDLLAAERTALNFLQHLSGIATLTRKYVKAVEGTGCLIVDTRKTSPGLRRLEKQAVAHGGGINHRMDLAEGYLIKENHIAACGSIREAVFRCRRHKKAPWIEVECETLDQVREAVEAGCDLILLDNMDIPTVAEARKLVPSTITLEASGGIHLDNAKSYALTGVDRLAVGAITHSAPALDLSMRVI